MYTFSLFEKMIKTYTNNSSTLAQTGMEPLPYKQVFT